MKHLAVLSLILISLYSCTTLPILEQVEQPKNFDSNFVWGINGHPIMSRDYESAPLELQINLLKEHQIDFYRIDVNTDLNGAISPTKQDRFNKLLNLSSANQIKILPVIRVYEHLEKANFNVSSTQAYQMGFDQAKGFVETYGSHFEYYELGNEMDIKTISESKLRGKEISEYKLNELELIANYLKGMIVAIKDSKPSSKILINISGWLRWGFLDYMVENKVDFDILSYHWYSEGGLDIFDINNSQYDIYSTLVQKYNKPIWLTEINKLGGDINNTDREQAKMMDLYIQNLKNKPYIKGFFIYELFDQPLHWAGDKETNFGIIRWKNNPPNYSRYDYKPVSKVLKYNIEEAKFGHEDFIYAVLRSLDLDKEQPSKVDFNYWISRFQVSRNNESILREILNTQKPSLLEKVSEPDIQQGSIPFITNIYQTILNRKPDEKEVKFWNKNLNKKITQKDLLIEILLSKEYWRNAIWKGYEKRTGFQRLN